jgi:pimeloyl-ACP methyl ester carboxylesterase
MHASGDEIVPVERSRTLAAELTHPDSDFVEVPGGHHRSIQHDPELVAVAIEFLATQLAGDQPPG